MADGGDVLKVKEAMVYTHLVRENLSDLPGVQRVAHEREAPGELA